MPFFARRATRRVSVAPELVKTKRGREFLRLQAERNEFFRCSGMHTRAVRSVVEAVCKREWSMTHPFSSSELLIPAFTRGVHEQLESVCQIHSEIAVYSALIASLFMPLAGELALPESNYRYLYSTSYYVGWVCSWVNILTSIFFRFAIGSMARESDMLVFLAWSRHYSVINISFFIANLYSFGAALNSGRAKLEHGDYCLDGSLSFMKWWYEWCGSDVGDSEIPVGQGVVYDEGVPIRNPWTLKAEELVLSCDEKVEWWKSAHIKKYIEFMHDYFNLQGLQCNSGMGPYSPPIHRILIGIMVVGILVILICFRNARLYWMKTATPLPVPPFTLWGEVFTYITNTFYRPDKDPYDMTIAWKDFEKRAEVGRKLAERDGNGSDCVDPLGNHDDVLEEMDETEPMPVQFETYKLELEGAGLSIDDMSTVGEDLLNTWLEEIGILRVGDRLKMIRYVKSLTGGASGGVGEI